MKKLMAVLLSICCCAVLWACAKQCEHQYKEEITTQASCSTTGIKTFTCAHCNKSYTEEIPKLEHNYVGTVTQEATCSSKGITTFTCSLCNNSYTEDIDKVEHTFADAVVTRKPTCVEEGESTAKCTVCGEAKIGSIAKAQHTYKSKTTKEPTCTATGTKTLTCSVCGDTKTESIAKAQHTYKSKTTKEPACTATGTKTLTCSVCGDTKTESIAALGHNYSQAETQKVTCTTDGEKMTTCSRCGDSFTEAVKSTGHDWVQATCTNAKYCTKCDQKEGSALGHTTQQGVCSRCRKEISLSDNCSGTFRNTFPCSVSQYPGSGCTGTVSISNASIKFWDSYGGKVYLRVSFTGTVTYLGSRESCMFYIRVYNSIGVLIENQLCWISSPVLGLASQKDIDIRLDPGQYTVEFVNYT